MSAVDAGEVIKKRKRRQSLSNEPGKLHLRQEDDEVLELPISVRRKSQPASLAIIQSLPLSLSRYSKKRVDAELASPPPNMSQLTRALGFGVRSRPDDPMHTMSTYFHWIRDQEQDVRQRHIEQRRSADREQGIEWRVRDEISDEDNESRSSPNDQETDRSEGSPSKQVLLQQRRFTFQGGQESISKKPDT